MRAIHYIIKITFNLNSTMFTGKKKKEKRGVGDRKEESRDKQEYRGRERRGGEGVHQIGPRAIWR